MDESKGVDESSTEKHPEETAAEDENASENKVESETPTVLVPHVDEEQEQSLTTPPAPPVVDAAAECEPADNAPTDVGTTEKEENSENTLNEVNVADVVNSAEAAEAAEAADAENTQQIDENSSSKIDEISSAAVEPTEDVPFNEEKDLEDEAKVEETSTPMDIVDSAPPLPLPMINNDVENLLEATDFVPDSADIIDDQKRKCSSNGSAEDSMSRKKMKLSDEDGNGDGDGNDKDHDQEHESQEDEELDEAETMSEGNSNVDRLVDGQSNNDEFREKHYESDVDGALLDAAHGDDQEKGDALPLQLADILTQGGNSGEAKTIELADLIDQTDVLKEIGREIDENRMDEEKNATEGSRDGEDGAVGESTDDNGKDEIDKLADSEMDFDLSAKLKEMDEISLGPVSKTDRKLAADFNLTDEVSLEITKKSGSTDTEDKRKISNLRKNIREVMDDTQLDASTLAAQREELERLARVQEQQRIIREMQRQIAHDRQNSKTQDRVLSLLQGHTSLLKSSSAAGNSVSAAAGASSSSSATTSLKRLVQPGQADVSIAPIKSQKKTETTTAMDDLEMPIDLGGDDDENIDDENNVDNDFDDSNLSEIMETKLGSEIVDDSDDDDVIELKPKKDIVTIEDSSDDDCILLSDEEELPEDGDDDPQNSGLHVNDAYNVPDEQGRVVINIGHPEGEEDIFLAPQIARIIKPHQIGGVRFLFDNIIESVERFNTSTGFGCILAHSMGLGKTLQLCCFCDIFLRHTSSKTILCIMPINTLQNWLAEFNMWLPDDPEKSPLKEQGEVRPRNFKLFVLNDTHKTLNARSKVILDWAKEGGVLLIGYELYRLLSLKKMTKRRGRKTARDPEIEEKEAAEHKKLLDEMHAALVKPGPDLIVCDEGHRIKNSHASISVALKQIRSKRRIVLTGYPLQNNLLEYWCMVDFVRPNYLGTKTEFSNMFERPIQNGQCIDSTPQDIKLMRYRAHVLHSLLLGFVQRRSHVVLQNSLPQKQEFVLLVRMTPFQRKLYDVFMNEVVRTKAVPNPLKAFAVCCKIWNHPDVLYNFLKKREADLDLEEAEAAAADPTYEPPISAPPTPAKAKKKPSPTTSKKGKKGAIEPAAKANDKPAATIPPNKIETNVNSDLSDASKTDALKTENMDMMKTEPKPFEDNKLMPTGMGNAVASPYLNAMQSSNLPPPTNPNYSHSPYGGYGSSYNSYNQYDPNSYYNSYGQASMYGGAGGSAIPPMHNNYYQDYGAHYNQSDYGQSQNSYWPGMSHQYYPPQPHHHHSDYQAVNSANYPGYGANSYPMSNYHHSSQSASNYHAMSSMHQRYPTNEWNNASHDPSASSVANNAIAPNAVGGDKNATNAIGAGSNGCEEMKIKNSPTPTPAQVSTSATAAANDAAADTVKSEAAAEAKMEKDEEKSETDKSDKTEDDAKSDVKDDGKDEKDVKVKDDGIPYDWAVELMKGYTPDLIENSPKMEIFFCILEESIRLGDRMLIFSQSLLTLNLIEKFLQANPTAVTDTEIRWAKNTNYYRLDGSTAAQEREKLINEFNANENVHLFLVSTRAGSLGINLVGANRVVVFDASWNPCHDTQAVCRVYRYGQKKPCFVYRLVMDNCLEKKIYDRQVNKQGMSDRVVDECNPDAHLSLKEVTNLCYDDEKETEICDFTDSIDKYTDCVTKKIIENFSKRMTKEPFQHESLLIDRKEKKLSMAEKRLAQRGYELEKQAATTKPSYTIYNANRQQIGTYRATRPDGVVVTRPVASVRPMQADNANNRNATARPTKWIPAEVWQRQGMTAQVLTLPGDVVIPTSSAEKSNIILKEGQKVMVLKSPKGIYMQLETGKIIAIRTALKVGGSQSKDKPVTQNTFPQKRIAAASPLKQITAAGNTTTTNSTVGSTPTITATVAGVNKMQANVVRQRNTVSHVNFGRNNVNANKNVQLGTARPYNSKPSGKMSPKTAAAAMMQGQYPTSNSNSSFDADISDESQLFERIDASNGSNISQAIEDESNEGETEMQKKLNDAQPMEIKCSELMPKTPTNLPQKEAPSIVPATQQPPNEMMNKTINAVTASNNAGQNFNADTRMNAITNEQASNKMQSPMMVDSAAAAANNYKNSNNFVPHQPYYNYNSNGNAQQSQTTSMHQHSQMQAQNQTQSHRQTNYQHQSNLGNQTHHHQQQQAQQPQQQQQPQTQQQPQPEKKAIQPSVHQPPPMQTQQQYHTSIQSDYYQSSSSAHTQQQHQSTPVQNDHAPRNQNMYPACNSRQNLVSPIQPMQSALPANQMSTNGVAQAPPQDHSTIAHDPHRQHLRPVSGTVPSSSSEHYRHNAAQPQPQQQQQQQQQQPQQQQQQSPPATQSAQYPQHSQHPQHQQQSHLQRSNYYGTTETAATTAAHQPQQQPENQLGLGTSKWSSAAPSGMQMSHLQQSQSQTQSQSQPQLQSQSQPQPQSQTNYHHQSQSQAHQSQSQAHQSQSHQSQSQAHQSQAQQSQAHQSQAHQSQTHQSQAHQSRQSEKPAQGIYQHSSTSGAHNQHQISHLQSQHYQSTNQQTNLAQMSQNNYAGGVGSGGGGSTASDYQHQSHRQAAPTAYQTQNIDYGSSSTSSMSYATPSPSQYSFASSSPSTMPVPSPDIRQQPGSALPSAATAGPAAVPHMPMDDDANMQQQQQQQQQQHRDYSGMNQSQYHQHHPYKMPEKKSTYAAPMHSANPYPPHSAPDMSAAAAAAAEQQYMANQMYPTETKSSLKKYRHKQLPKTPHGYGSGVDDPYNPYAMDAGQSTLSFLEKTASSIDESKSAFKASLSNITKPTIETSPYGHPAQPYTSPAAPPPTKPKPKPRSRSKKAATPAPIVPPPVVNKNEHIIRTEPKPPKEKAPKKSKTDGTPSPYSASMTPDMGSPLPQGATQTAHAQPMASGYGGLPMPNYPYSDYHHTPSAAYLPHALQTPSHAQKNPMADLQAPVLSTPSSMHLPTDNTMSYARSSSSSSASAHHQHSYPSKMDSHQTTLTSSASSMPSSQLSSHSSVGHGYAGGSGGTTTSSSSSSSAGHSTADMRSQKSQHASASQQHSLTSAVPPSDPMSSYATSAAYPPYMGYSAYASALPSGIPPSSLAPYGSSQQTSYNDSSASAYNTSATSSRIGSSSAFHKPDDTLTSSSLSTPTYSQSAQSHSSHSLQSAMTPAQSSLSSYGSPASSYQQSDQAATGVSDHASGKTDSATTKADPAPGKADHAVSHSNMYPLIPPPAQALPTVAPLPYQQPYYAPQPPAAFSSAFGSYQTPNPYASQAYAPSLQSQYPSAQYPTHPSYPLQNPTLQSGLDASQYRSYAAAAAASAYNYSPYQQPPQGPWHP